MVLARKCSEIISDVSDGDCLHPYIYISLFKWIYIYVTYFFRYVQCSMCPSKTQVKKHTKVIEKHSLLWYLKLSATEG